MRGLLCEPVGRDNREGTLWPGRRTVEVTFDVDLSARDGMASYHVGVDVTRALFTEVVWRCRVCGHQGGGGEAWDETPPRRTGWASLDSACGCPAGVDFEARGLVGGYPARLVWQGGGLRSQVCEQGPVVLGQVCDVLAWLEAFGLSGLDRS